MIGPGEMVPFDGDELFAAAISIAIVSAIRPLPRSPREDLSMLRWLIRRKLDAEEKKLGASVDYLRHVVDVSPALFLRFASILPFANSRKRLPKEA